MARFSPELAIVGTIAVILVAPLIVGRSARITGAITIAGLIVAAVFTLQVSDRVADAGYTGLAPVPAAGMLIADNLSVFFTLILLSIRFLPMVAMAEVKTVMPIADAHGGERRSVGDYHGDIPRDLRDGGSH